jgi:hypothetical protein
MASEKYDPEAGDYDFASVVERPLDREVHARVRTFKTWPPDKRAECRLGISPDEPYTLIHFARRSAILALQEQSVGRCEDGLLALAMIDETRIDKRDGASAVGLLAHALGATATDGNRLVNGVAALATPAMAKLLMRATVRLPLSELCYAEVETGQGRVGLVRSGLFKRSTASET